LFCFHFLDVVVSFTLHFVGMLDRASRPYFAAPVRPNDQIYLPLNSPFVLETLSSASLCRPFRLLLEGVLVGRKMDVD
jgi:hypothetical protein